MRAPGIVTLLILAWAGAAAAEDERTLDEICGQTLTANTVVRTQGGSMSFGGCVLVLDNARLRILEANLAGQSLSVTGIGAARLLIIGTRLRADLAVTGDYQRVLLSNSLFFARSAAVDLGAGEVQIRFSTFRPGEVAVSTEEGAIRVQSARFRRLATFLTGSGGADIRLSNFLGGIGVTTEGPGDLAFLSNVTRDRAEFRGAGRVAVAANTFELAPGSGIGDVVAVGSELAFLNNLARGDVSLQGDLSLMMVGNTFESGRPSLDGTPPSCIIINNQPRVRCPRAGPRAGPPRSRCSLTCGARQVRSARLRRQAYAPACVGRSTHPAQRPNSVRAGSTAAPAGGLEWPCSIGMTPVNACQAPTIS